MIVRGDALRLPFPDRAFDLVIGSPPYIDARLYLEDGVNLGVSRDCLEWVDWMLKVTEEALRVSKGAVIWVVCGVTRDRNYQPGPEGLRWEWWRRGGECHNLAPFYWNRSGIPGSGGDQWYRADVEQCLCFKRPGKLPYANPKANGHRPKWAPGGEMSHRLGNGQRRNDWGGNRSSSSSVAKGGVKPRATQYESCSLQDLNRDRGPTLFDVGEPIGEQEPIHPFTAKWGKPPGETIWRRLDGSKDRRESRKHNHTKRQPNGEMRDQNYDPPAIANPGNLLRTNNGGGSLGHALAHENEAPYNVDVPKFFINSHCPPGGVVLDPFSGSASTGQAALDLGRRYVGVDLRQSQCLLSRKRLATVTPAFEFFGNPD